MTNPLLTQGVDECCPREHPIGLQSFPADASSDRIKEGLMLMQDFEARAYKNYKWIVADPRLLGGALAIRTTGLSVALILECLANGMSLEDIDERRKLRSLLPARSAH